MESVFSKLYKDVKTYMEEGRVKKVLKVGYSVRIKPEDRRIGIYREDCILTEEGSYSKGRLRKVMYRGEPTPRGIYKLIGVEFREIEDEEAIPFLRVKRIEGYKEVLSEYLFLPKRGDIVLLQSGRGEVVGRVSPVSSLEDLLLRSTELWKIVGDLSR